MIEVNNLPTQLKSVIGQDSVCHFYFCILGGYFLQASFQVSLLYQIPG